MTQILTVRSFPWRPAKGCLQLGPITVPCALGRASVSRFKREGDGATPVGRFELLYGYYRPDRGLRPRTRLPLKRLSKIDGWCDDADHPRYNRPVSLPFSASHEVMWREDRLYDIVLVLNCNMYPAVKGCGSAIFFHVAREDYRPTQGCVAVAPRDMRLILETVQAGDVVEIR
ncbi:L,D-peptidoglycan transpeptidase YkuD (ErfK/YbiS/YcfS/YnhG family) [Roseibium hamelinense]|uniref:L,D-peptidoglycan transpeptidase YkuD (ErfK/YbiS/YcfS/YnhG family) n=1 Tax=Roseibium hamelinense TaxID=150831 RepID=A0A562SP93_9HYPH|nr:L,D-peptidoglycan transpeptidase YkuD (ErfK/YbiS/YcfS/YnhG family) [Roseibium hamelinense]